MNGRLCYNEAYHETICSVRKYVWPSTKQIHDQVGGWIVVDYGLSHAPTCSACGFVGEHEYHDEDGEIIDEY